MKAFLWCSYLKCQWLEWNRWKSFWRFSDEGDDHLVRISNHSTKKNAHAKVEKWISNLWFLWNQCQLGIGPKFCSKFWLQMPLEALRTVLFGLIFNSLGRKITSYNKYLKVNPDFFHFRIKFLISKIGIFWQIFHSQMQKISWKPVKAQACEHSFWYGNTIILKYVYWFA